MTALVCIRAYYSKTTADYREQFDNNIPEVIKKTWYSPKLTKNSLAIPKKHKERLGINHPKYAHCPVTSGIVVTTTSGTLSSCVTLMCRHITSDSIHTPRANYTVDYQRSAL